MISTSARSDLGLGLAPRGQGASHPARQHWPIDIQTESSVFDPAFDKVLPARVTAVLTNRDISDSSALVVNRASTAEQLQGGRR